MQTASQQLEHHPALDLEDQLVTVIDTVLLVERSKAIADQARDVARPGPQRPRQLESHVMSNCPSPTGTTSTTLELAGWKLDTGSDRHHHRIADDAPAQSGAHVADPRARASDVVEAHEERNLKRRGPRTPLIVEEQSRRPTAAVEEEGDALAFEKVAFS